MRSMFRFLLADFTLDASERGSPNYWGEFTSMLMTLGVILLLIFVTVFVLKRLMRSRVKQLNSQAGIKVLERRALNAKASLYLVDVLGKGVVISESAAGIQLITELPEELDAVQALDDLQESDLEPGPSFAQKLRKLAARNG